MTKQEYKEWYRQTRIQAKEQAKTMFEKDPDIQTVIVPFIQPIYHTSPECEAWHFERQLYNAAASIEGREQIPDDTFMGEIRVKRTE